MPNGHDKNWLRLLAAIDGFRTRYGRWPTQIRAFDGSLRNLREHLFLPESFARLTEKIKLIADDVPFVAEDDAGNSYSYGADGFPHSRPSPNAGEWLGIRPDLHET